jgi:hypothetical protein
MYPATVIERGPAWGAGNVQPNICWPFGIDRLATEELEMNAAKSKGAWMALLAAGGLYAWQNRDKIQGWLNSQREQFGSQPSSSLPATGATRRIDAQDVPPANDTRGIYNS